MLCDACEESWSSIHLTEPGIWNGSEPELFSYPSQTDTWMGSHHADFGGFISAVKRACYVCSTIFRDMSHELRVQASLCRTFYQLRYVTQDDGFKDFQDHYELRFTIEIVEGQMPLPKEQVVECSGTFKILPKNEVVLSGKPLELSNNTFSGICKDQVQRWLTDCVNYHELCNQDWRIEKNYPARLLNISEETRFVLQDTEQVAIRPSYVTLSHCWESEMPLKLTTNTRRDLMRGMSIEELSMRFQDAIKIARWMGIDYIWIDALCIEQDSQEDWLVQSARMGDIYTNSYCNIAATSKGPNRGCFTNRARSLVESYPISDPLSGGDLSETHFIGYNDFWRNSLLDTTLHNRAWVLQERLLSPRTIHFGQEQIFWECRCQMACEAYPAGIPHQLRNDKTREWRSSDRMLDPEQRSILASSLNPWPQVYAIWSKTIERYMECKMTYREDKLIAVSGIAQKVAEVTNERYLAGLWDNSQLPQSLLWYVLGRRQADGTTSLRVGSVGRRDYRAPSWSWASLEAKVKWNWPSDCDRILIDITKTQVTTSFADSRFGSVRAAAMEVSGCLFQAIIEAINRGVDGAPEEDGQYTLRLQSEDATRTKVIEPTVYLDVPLMPRSSSLEVCLLPVCTGWRGRSNHLVTRLAGLLVRKAFPTKEPVYERVGVFSLNDAETCSLYDARGHSSDVLQTRLATWEKMNITLI